MMSVKIEIDDLIYAKQTLKNSRQISQYPASLESGTVNVDILAQFNFSASGIKRDISMAKFTAHTT